MKRGELITVVAAREYGKPRPALVIQANRAEGSESVVVLLLSSTLTNTPSVRYQLEPNDVNGLRLTSEVQIDKIQAIPLSRIGGTIGRLDEPTMERITRLLAVFLGIV